MHAAAAPVVERACESFWARFGARPARVAIAPGRINILGGHTDYNQGLALPAAIDRWVAAACASRDDPLWRAAHEGDEVEVIGPTPPDRGPSWVPYLHGVARMLARESPLPHGFDLAFAGSVPIGAGLGSSAALELAPACALDALYGRTRTPWARAELCRKAESRHAGVPCGLLDQVASACARHGHWSEIDFEASSVRPIPVDQSRHRWVVVDSAVRRALADGRYRRRVEECRAAATALGVSSLRTAPPGAWRTLPTEILQRRARHVESENERVRAGAAAARAGALDSIGRLLVESHLSLRDDYQIGCPELDFLVDAAAGIKGWLGGRLMGGGFGGVTLHLVRRHAAEAFLAELRARFERRFGRPTEGWILRSVGAAGLWPDPRPPRASDPHSGTQTR